MVTTTSAAATRSSESRLGRAPARSTPSSRMTVTTSGCTCPAGSASLPADRARCRSPAARLKSAALICERPALCRQTKSEVKMESVRSPRRGGGPSAHPCAQRPQAVLGHGVEGPAVAALRVDEPGGHELGDVVGERGLREPEERGELALAQRLAVAAQHVE